MASHLNHGGKWIRKEKRWAIYLRDGLSCVYCLADLRNGQDGGDMTLDHLDEDGGNHETNLVTACRPCNIAKSGQALGAFASQDAKTRITKAIQTPLDISAAKTWLQKRALDAAPEATAAKGLPEIRANSILTAGAARITDKKLHELVMQGKVPAPTADGHDIITTLSRVIDWKNETVQTGDGDRARKNRAEADSAEMAAAKEAGKLCMIDDYRNNYADAIAQGVQAISRLAIPAAHKELVFAALRGVKLADLEAGEN